MFKLKKTLGRHFWPISAMVFCPCHLPLSMGILAGLSGGTILGSYISAHYQAIESFLAVTFSFYFVVAFMIWAVRGPRRPAELAEGRVCNTPIGLSTKQIVGWGLLGSMMMPLVIVASLVVREGMIPTLVEQARGFDIGGSGLIWLLSISTFVMIPVMVIWLVWMWIAWSGASRDSADADSWQYEYE